MTPMPQWQAIPSIRAALIALLVVSFTGKSAFATSYSYVRTTTCGGESRPACKSGQSPIPIYWPHACAIFYIDQRGSKRDASDKSKLEIDPDAIEAIVQGFTAWNTAKQSSLTYSYGGLTNETDARWNPESANLNAIVWQDEWPDDLPDAIAVTSVSFKPKTGMIVDADIELNSGGAYRFTFSDYFVQTDLQNTVAHEAGHFLGLAHTLDKEATMYGKANAHETKKRTLENVDYLGVSAIYPNTIVPTCKVPKKPTFFDIKNPPPDAYPPKSAQKSGGCCSTVSPRHSSAPLTDLSIWLVLGAFGLMRIRRRLPSYNP